MPVRRLLDRSRLNVRTSGRKSLTGREAVHRAAAYVVERLESRRLLTTLSGGGFSLQGVPLENDFLYLDASNNVVRIAVWGTISAEATFVRVDKFNGLHVGDLVPPTLADMTAKDGADLFNVYVASADPRSSISISTISVPPPTQSFASQPMQPFITGTISLNVINAQSGVLNNNFIAPDAGTGATYLGAREFLKPATTPVGTPTGPNTPILSVPLTRPVGVRPVTASGKIDAGLTTAPGVSLNRFFFGGTVTGRVDIGGSIDTFYCGALLTGDASGVLNGEQPAAAYQHNFNVGGDLDNLIVKGSIGTNNLNSVTTPAYKTGFRLSVGGHIGEIVSKDSFYGSGSAIDSPTIKGSGKTQVEEESSGTANVANESFFEGNANVSADKIGVPSLGDDPTDFNNDTFANAQFLGTRFSSLEGHRAVQLQGTINNSPGVNDAVDMYALPLLGGQTITITLKALQQAGISPILPGAIAASGELGLGVFSPEAPTLGTGLLLSNYHDGSTLRQANEPISFTATEPGVYYIAVAYNGNITFAAGNSGLLVGEAPYELDITGVKELGLGGLVATTNIAFTEGTDLTTINGLTNFASDVHSFPTLSTENGDLGAIVSTGGGSITEGDDAISTLLIDRPGPISAANGSIRVLQAGTIGSEIFGGALAPDLYASQNVGLVRTLTAGGDMAINLALNASTGEPTPIGGSYQLVDCNGLFVSNLEADQAIGTIRTEDIGSAALAAPILHVNADNKGSDGFIDLIDVTGDPISSPATGHFGTLATGGPRLITGPGGDVRYIRVAPFVQVFNDDFFGGNQDPVIQYPTGTKLNLTDDSGTPFTLSPFVGQSDVVTPPSNGTTTTGTSTTGTSTTGTTTTGTTTSLTAGSLNVLTYGVEDKGGVVVMDVTVLPGSTVVTTPSTGTDTTSSTTTGTTVTPGPASLTVSTSAKGNAGSLEIGEIDVVGGGTTLNFDPATRTFTQAAGPGAVAAQGASVTMIGKSRIDVLSIYGVTGQLFNVGDGGGNTAEPLSGLTNVENQTNGEIVNVFASSIINLEALTLGEAESHTDSNVSGASVILNQFPFEEQRNMIQIGGQMLRAGTTGDPTVGNLGAAQTIVSRGALGNILVTGTIGSLIADDGHGKTKGSFNGINGVVYAASPGEYSGPPAYMNTVGNILSVDIGQGLAFSGTGDYAAAGIFADNFIGTVTNDGEGSDIRGDIASGMAAGGLAPVSRVNTITGLPIPDNALHGTAIDSIKLTDGAIIGGNIFTALNFTELLQTRLGTITVSTPNAGSTTPAFALGSVNLTGNGGIIDSFFAVGGLGTLSIKGGFGIVSSFFAALGTDTFGNITTDGYGIRSSVVVGALRVGSIIATGKGKELPVTSYTPSVRQSESGPVDQFSGYVLDPLNDLDLFLGVRKSKPKRVGTTEAGVIADSRFTGNESLNTLQAFRLIASPITTVTAGQAGSIATTVPTTMFIDFGNSIGKINILESVNHVAITSGTINSIDIGKSAVSTVLNVAGEIKEMSAGFISGSSHINVTGPDGVLNSLTTKAGLNGYVTATAGIGDLVVGTDLGSPSIATSGNLDQLVVKHSILSGAFVRVKKTLGSLIVRHNLLAGSTVQAQKIGSQKIGGVDNGNIIITG